MKVIIQTLKAPWPAGAKVGDVVAFKGDVAPAWAVGKFVSAPDSVEASFLYEPKVIEGDGAGVALPPADEATAIVESEAQAKADEEAQVAAALADADAQAAEEKAKAARGKK